MRDAKEIQEAVYWINRAMMLEAALNLACKEVVAVDEGNCPGCPKNQSGMKCGVTQSLEKYAECWKEYFIKKAEEMMEVTG